MLPVLCIYGAAGLALYLYRAYEAGTVISFSVFSVADLLVWAQSPFIYILFVLPPVMAGGLMILRGHPSGPRMLLYTNRMGLFKRQLAGLLAWGFVVTAFSVAVTVMAGLLWKKELINWGSARSYLTMVMHMVLPKVRFCQVLLACILAQFLRNLVFLLALAVSWWAYNTTCGIAAVSGLCFAELGMGQVKAVLGYISAGYGFWAGAADKAAFAAAAAVLLAVLCPLAVKSVKRKEFL